MSDVKTHSPLIDALLDDAFQVLQLYTSPTDVEWIVLRDHLALKFKKTLRRKWRLKGKG